MLSAAIFDYYADRAEHFLATKELPESPGAVLKTEPIGVILAIEPWNFPYYQLARVVAPQLIAGNVVVAKHAQYVPQCAEHSLNSSSEPEPPRESTPTSSPLSNKSET